MHRFSSNPVSPGPRRREAPAWLQSEKSLRAPLGFDRLDRQIAMAELRGS
jgi:hypothetical protein